MARRPGEVPQRWEWTEPTVWTSRMLEALERGMKGGKWFSLIDKVYAPANLNAAFRKVRGNKGGAGVDHQTIEQFEARASDRLPDLSEQLRTKRYRPQHIKRTWIPKPGSAEKRPLGIPTVTDRIVQTALRNVIEPIFEWTFAAHSYGFRPNRGAKHALRRVDQLLREGYVHIVDADIKGYFDAIPHDLLMQRVEEHISDGEVLELIRAYLNQQVMDGLETWTPTQGSPQGAVISPLLANLYLNPLDHLMAALGHEMTRYADDFVVMCRTSEEADAALAAIRLWMDENGLTLHPTKTKLVDYRQEGFEFLGYRFENGKRWSRKKSMQALKATIRAKTPRTSGLKMVSIVASLNRTLRGWFEYFKHAYKTTFREVDGFVRRRLRSILRTRLKRGNNRRFARGGDNVRWPNKFFHALELFSLVRARERHLQSVATGNH